MSAKRAKLIRKYADRKHGTAGSQLPARKIRKLYNKASWPTKTVMGRVLLDFIRADDVKKELAKHVAANPPKETL